MKNLIMGYATNQTAESLEVFLRSARESHPRETTDIAVITNRVVDMEALIIEVEATAFHTPSIYSPGLTRMGKLWGRILIHLLRLWVKFGTKGSAKELEESLWGVIEIFHHPHFSRWAAYCRILKFTRHRYDRVFLCDVKDVFFQENVFSNMRSDTAVLYEDGDLFSESSWNGKWVKDGFGSSGLAKISQNTPICVGTIGGGTHSVLDLAEEFLKSFATFPFTTVEQGLFNYLFYTGYFSTSPIVEKNFVAEVATLVWWDIVKRTRIEDGKIRNALNGRVFPCVHGWDRSEEARTMVLSIYSKPSSSTTLS